MSNANPTPAGYDARFAGLDEASVEDRNPKIPHSTVGRAEVTKVSSKDGRYGKTFIIEQKILESNNPECKVGGEYTVTITDYMGKDMKLKLGKIKNFVASAFGVAPESPQKWMQLAAYCCDEDAAVGKIVRFQTGPVSTAVGSGKSYVACVYSPDEAVSAEA